MLCSVALFFFTCVGNIYAEKGVVRLSANKMTKALPVFQRCIHDTDVSPVAVHQFRNGKLLEDDEKLPELIHCFFVNAGYAGKTGHIMIEKAMNVVPEGPHVERTTIKKVIEECNEEYGADPQETTFKIVKCVVEKAPFRLIF